MARRTGLAALDRMEDDDLEEETVRESFPPAPPESGVMRRYTRRSKSLSYRRKLTRVEREEMVSLERTLEAEAGSPAKVRLPMTRGECLQGSNAQRPCPFVSCRHHLYLEAEATGSVKVNFPDLLPGEILETCSLDVVDRGGATLDEVGNLINVTRERARQIEEKALLKFKRNARLLGVDVEALFGLK